MSKYWNNLVSNIEPYVPGEQPRDQSYIKLNTNENPYPPSPKVKEVIRACSMEELRLYPDPECLQLKQTLATTYGVQDDQVFVGNGSDEVLAFAFRSFFDENRPILFPDITYSFYKVYAQLYGIPYQLISLDSNLNVDLDSFNIPHGGIVLPNPNAPTSIGLPTNDLSKFVEKHINTVIIIDEAYIDFGGQSMTKFITDYPNLLVVQSLSKSRSLAGMRVGYAFGQHHLIEGLERIKNSFNSYTVDRIAMKAAIAAIHDVSYFEETRLRIMNTREKTKQQLEQLGFHVLPSQANFLFITHPHLEAARLFSTLKEQGILVRYFDKPRIKPYLRVTIGTEQAMKTFLEKLNKIITE